VQLTGTIADDEANFKTISSVNSCGMVTTNTENKRTGTAIRSTKEIANKKRCLLTSANRKIVTNTISTNTVSRWLHVTVAE